MASFKRATFNGGIVSRPIYFGEDITQWAATSRTAVGASRFNSRRRLYMTVNPANNVEHFDIVETDGGALARHGWYASTPALPGVAVFDIWNDGAATHFRVQANELGFYSAAPIAKQTVVGAKGGNVALANLLTALANLGLLTDNTT